MITRNIVKIDRQKCDGCGLCVKACAEGAIEIVDGKARLVSEVYCDGLGACIGHCPRNAITVEKQQAKPFDQEAVHAHLAAQKSTTQPDDTRQPHIHEPHTHGPHAHKHSDFVCPSVVARQLKVNKTQGKDHPEIPSQLSNWPIQIKLLPPAAPFLQNANLLIAADCVPFALADFHRTFLNEHTVAIGCPKLDDADYYVEKLSQLIAGNNLAGITVVHMEVPCCSGLTHITQQAIRQSSKSMPFEDVTISIDGRVIKKEILNPHQN